MKLRLAALEDLDPLSVPLPHGTEVMTRVDRRVGERLVPQGALGRVVVKRGEVYEVAVVGCGRVAYVREELQPRSPGQLRFACLRETAWNALLPCVVLEATVGSRAWGLADAGSDVDRRGLFVLPFSWTTALVEPPLDLVSADGSSSFWEVGKGLRQGIRADPNTLEMLFVDSCAARDEMGEWILEARDAFVSQEMYGSFGRYALSQLEKLSQTQRLAENRNLVVSWLRGEPGLTLDQVAGRLAQASDIAAPSPQDAHRRAREYVKQLYRSMYDQGLLASREFSALVEFVRAGAVDFDEPRHLRPKNAYNLLRLVDSAIHWLRSGTPRLVVESPLRETLLEIKRGELPLAEVLRLAEERMPELEAARHDSPLPARADVERIDGLLRRVRTEAARRHVEGRAGPFGAAAPRLPAASWSE